MLVLVCTKNANVAFYFKMYETNKKVFKPVDDISNHVFGMTMVNNKFAYKDIDKAHFR